MHFPTNILHHYTSGSGLHGIFDSDSLWATSIHYLNDSREFVHAIELGAAALHRVGAGDARCKEFCAAVNGHLGTIERLGVYVSCFSEVQDSLSQWRGYCPPGFGYSLGFDADKLRTVVRQQGFDLSKCLYDRESQEAAMDDWARSTIGQLVASCPSGADPTKFVHDNCNGFMHAFVRLAPTLKDPSFKDEREWRLSALVPGNDGRIRLRPGRSMLVPYVPVSLKLSSRDSPLCDVMVGPTPHTQLAMNAVCHFFTKAKFGVRHSTSPYRDW